MVMIGKIMSLALMAVLIFPPLAVAADPPDLKGRWIGKTHSIIAGKGGHWPTSSGTFEIDGDTLSFCYGHASGKGQSSVVSCSEAKRAR
jgi:hypothetical protein